MEREHRPPGTERGGGGAPAERADEHTFGASPLDGPLAGESVEAERNRAFRSEAAALTRERARAVRNGLADIRSRARIMCDRAAAVGVARTRAPRPDGESRHLRSL